MKWRRCSKCNDLYTIDNFYFSNKKEGKRHYKCIKCTKAERKNNKEILKTYQREWYGKNKEKKLKKCKEWRENNKERKREADKEYYDSNREAISNYHKKYNKENKKDIREKKRKYYLENRERILERQKTYNSNRAREDVNVRLKKNINRAISQSLKENSSFKDLKKIEELIGYPLAVLKDALENKFEDWMTWENFEIAWQIDHIIPQSLYNFLDESEIKKCWNYRNLRPVDSTTSLQKSQALSMLLIEELKLEDLLPAYIIV